MKQNYDDNIIFITKKIIIKHFIFRFHTAINLLFTFNVNTILYSNKSSGNSFDLGKFVIVAKEKNPSTGAEDATGVLYRRRFR